MLSMLKLEYKNMWKVFQSKKRAELKWTFLRNILAIWHEGE